MKITVSATYEAALEATVELPQGVCPEEISFMWVYWNDVHANLKNGRTIKLGTTNDSDAMRIVDGKRPVRIDVYGVDEEGETDYDSIIFADS